MVKFHSHASKYGALSRSSLYVFCLQQCFQILLQLLCGPQCSKPGIVYQPGLPSGHRQISCSIFTHVALAGQFPGFITAPACPGTIEDRETGWSGLYERKKKSNLCHPCIFLMSYICAGTLQSCPILCPFVCPKVSRTRVQEIRSSQWCSSIEDCFSPLGCITTVEQGPQPPLCSNYERIQTGFS